jgi:hypothetical protein
MGSRPRREERERKVRARSAEQPALNCESCGALTPASNFRNFGDRLVCQACENQNPQSRVRMVSREWLMPRAILLNFIPRDGYSVQAMHPDCRTMLGPYVKVQSAETLHRLLAYLGATPAQLAAFDEQRNRCGQGTAHVTLAPGRKNLLRLRR